MTGISSLIGKKKFREKLALHANEDKIAVIAFLHPKDPFDESYRHIAHKYPDIAFLNGCTTHSFRGRCKTRVNKFPCFIAFRHHREIDRCTVRNEIELEKFIDNLARLYETQESARDSITMSDITAVEPSESTVIHEFAVDSQAAKGGKRIKSKHSQRVGDKRDTKVSQSSRPISVARYLNWLYVTPIGTPRYCETIKPRYCTEEKPLLVNE